jgi:predicted DNA-binding protein
MARKNKSLADAFSQFEESEKKNVTVKDKPQSETKSSDVTPLHTGKEVKEDETVKRNTETVSKDVTPKRKAEVESASALENDNQEPPAATPSKTIKDVTNSILSMYDEKTKKKTVEETHNRATFLFRKDLQERLDNMADGKRGFKTMFMNKAIEALLDEMEDVSR